MHAITAKPRLRRGATPEFKAYQQQVVDNARALAAALVEKGYRLCSGGTDNHLMLVDLRGRDAELTGQDAETRLEEAGMIVNKNGIPNDPRPPMVTSGLRLGTPALTTRGLKESEMVQVADWLDRVMCAKGDRRPPRPSAMRSVPSAASSRCPTEEAQETACQNQKGPRRTRPESPSRIRFRPCTHGVPRRNGACAESVLPIVVGVHVRAEISDRPLPNGLRVTFVRSAAPRTWLPTKDFARRHERHLVPQ